MIGDVRFLISGSRIKHHISHVQRNALRRHYEQNFLRNKANRRPEPSECGSRNVKCGIGKDADESCETKPIPPRVGIQSCRDAISCVSDVSTGPAIRCRETQNVASLQKKGRAEGASHVAQPPSAEITAEGGGAPCVSTNGADSAKQSQSRAGGPLECELRNAEWERTSRSPAKQSQLVQDKLSSGRTAGTARPTGLISDCGLMEGGALAKHAKQSQTRARWGTSRDVQAGGVHGTPCDGSCETKPTEGSAKFDV